MVEVVVLMVQAENALVAERQVEQQVQVSQVQRGARSSLVEATGVVLVPADVGVGVALHVVLQERETAPPICRGAALIED